MVEQLSKLQGLNLVILARCLAPSLLRRLVSQIASFRGLVGFNFVYAYVLC